MYMYIHLKAGHPCVLYIHVPFLCLLPLYLFITSVYMHVHVHGFVCIVCLVCLSFLPTVRKLYTNCHVLISMYASLLSSVKNTALLVTDLTVYLYICTCISNSFPLFPGSIFHVRVHTPQRGLEHALLYSIGVNLPAHRVGQLDRILVLASPINDINIHAWDLNRVKLFHTTRHRCPDGAVCVVHDVTHPRSVHHFHTG